MALIRPQKFMDVAESLIYDHGYDVNMVNQRVTAADDVNFSDDQLAFLSYYIYARYAPAKYYSPLIASLARSAPIVLGERNSLFNAVYLSAMDTMVFAGAVGAPTSRAKSLNFPLAGIAALRARCRGGREILTPAQA